MTNTTVAFSVIPSDTSSSHELFQRFQSRLEESVRRHLPESVRGFGLEALLNEARDQELYVVVQLGRSAAILIDTLKEKILVDQHYLDLFFETEVLRHDYEMLDQQAEVHFIDRKDFEDQAIDLNYLAFPFVM